MKILFCNIAWMKFYKGIIKNIDEPKHGGAYVDENQTANEEYNFSPLVLDDKSFCFGSVETKSTNGVDPNQMHIEKIEGCQIEDESTDGVLVIWCALKEDGIDKTRTVVVGWYSNATLYRKFQKIEVQYEDGSIEELWYNVEAEGENCVLLPVGERNKNCWTVPRKKAKGIKYGFGQSNVWYANEPEALDFKKKLTKIINEYNGENWINTEPQ